MLHTNFQQNKDCNTTCSRRSSPYRSSCIRTSSKTRTATLFAQFSPSCLPTVAYGLPAKQGLQLAIPRFRYVRIPLLHTDFQQNKDCNIQNCAPVNRLQICCIRTSSKTRTATLWQRRCEKPGWSCIRTSSKTRTATLHYRRHIRIPKQGCIRTSSKTRTASR